MSMLDRVVFVVVTSLVTAFVTVVLVDTGLRTSLSAVGLYQLNAVYQLQHGAFVAVSVRSLSRCGELQAAARDPGKLVEYTAPFSIDAAGLVKGQTYKIVGVSCADREGGRDAN